jgi:hypothetical protein
MKKVKVPNVKAHIERNQKHLVIMGVIVLVSIFMVVTALIVDSQRPKMYHLPDPKKAQAKEQQKIRATQQTEMQAIKKELKLPTDEQPIFATVAQKEQLQKQNFFKKSQNGDRVLLYPKHKKIILYRPSTQKIIAVSRLQFQDDITPTLTPVPSPSEQPEEASY